MANHAIADLSDSDTTGMIRVQAMVMMMKRLGASATEFLYGAVYWLEDMSRMQEGMTGMLGHCCRIPHNRNNLNFSHCAVQLQIYLDS